MLQKMLRYVIGHVLEHCPDELEMPFVPPQFSRVYAEAEILQERCKGWPEA